MFYGKLHGIFVRRQQKQQRPEGATPDDLRVGRHLLCTQESSDPKEEGLTYQKDYIAKTGGDFGGCEA